MRPAAPRPRSPRSDGIAFVKGLRHVTVKSAKAAVEVLKEGAANKRVRELARSGQSCGRAKPPPPPSAPAPRHRRWPRPP